METTSVTSKGQVTIPKALRQELGIHQGSQIQFLRVGKRVELRVHSAPPAPAASGFGLLKSKRRALPAGFDAATLLKK
jgi:AbrB family looped-hinge helix DNA binding protein